MRQQTLPIVVLTVLVVASALFMGWAALRTTTQTTATPTPVTPTPVTPPPASTAAPTADQSQSGGGSVDLGLLTVELPTEWRYQVNAWPVAAPAELADAPLLLAAWHGAASFDAAPLRFTVFAVDRNELSLERYASDVTEQLAGARDVNNVQTSLDTMFRADTLPVAYVRYTKESASGRQFGYQVATFDAHGDRIVIASLITQGSDNGEELLRTLVSSMHFADMPAVPQEGA